MKLAISSAILCLSLWTPQASIGEVTVALTGRAIVKMLPDAARPRIYALNRGSGALAGTLLALNPTNGLLMAEISLGVMPTDMALDSSGGALYVVNTGSRSLMKLDLESFSVTTTRAISTPNAYSLENPLHLAAGRSNVVYFTDGGWSPAVYCYDFQDGTSLSVFDDGNGVGGLAAARDGKTLYAWRQYGWGAGNVNSWVTRYDAQAAALAPLEQSFTSWRRDPLDTPILINWAESLVFNKQQAFVATNVSVLAQSFSENLYAITRDGSIAFGSSRVFVSASGIEVAALPFSSTVQAVSGNQRSLFRYRDAPSEVVIYPLADILGAGWETNQPPVADYARTPTNATTRDTIAFAGDFSADDQGAGAGLQYRWDWENDGVFDTPFTNQPAAAHRYNIAGTKTAVLQVKDRYGANSTATQTFTVVQEDDPGQPGGGNPQFEVQFPGADVAFDPVRPFAYVSGYANKTLVMLNLTNGLIERQFSFDWNPESIAISPDGQRMYVALLKRPHSSYWFGGHTSYIAEFDLVHRVKVKEFEILADPYDLAVTDGGILVAPGGSDQWTEIQTYRTATGQLLGSSGIRQECRIALHPSQSAVYTADTDLSPSDIQRYDLNPSTGEIVSGWDSRYHGDYPMNGGVWCDPGGASVIVRGGRVFSSSPAQAADMLYQSTLAGGAVEGAAFDPAHNALFTVGGSLLLYYNLRTLELVQSQAVTSKAKYVHANSNHVFVAWADGARTVFQRLANPAAGAETNHAPVASCVRTPTNATTRTTIIFDGSLSSDDQGGGAALAYRWDWENDGVFDTAFANDPATGHRYNIAGTKTAALQVKDRYGATSTVTQTFNVVQENDPGQPGGGNPHFVVQFAAADVAFDPVRPFAYVSGHANKTLVMVNLTNGLIERQFNFDWNPESIAISPDGRRMYVALLKRPHSAYWFGGHTNYIAEFDPVLRVKVKEFEILADPGALAATDRGLLFVAGGSDQGTDLRTYGTSTGQLLGTWSGLYMGCRIALHPSQQAVYTADNGLFPSDIERYSFDGATGQILSGWGSPYHGDYPMSGNVWCHPNGAVLIVRGGGVFSSSPVQAQDMRYQRALAGGAVEGAAFDLAHNALFTVAGAALRWYNLDAYELVMSQSVSNGVRFVHAIGRDLYLAGTSGATTFFQRIQNPALPDVFITQAPESQTGAAGSTVTFNVGVRGQAPITCQWFFQGGPLAGETAQFLVLNNIQPAQEGDYVVVAANAVGSVTSSVARLTVLVPPSITQQPQSLFVSAGSNAVFSVQASGSSVLRYQWSRDGMDIAGATNASLCIVNAQRADDGVYRVTIQNSAGLAFSAPAMLRVMPAAPSVVENPASQMLPAGSDARFSVEYTGGAPIGCEWVFNGRLIPEATGRTLVVSNIQAESSGYYLASLSNSAGQIRSAAAALTVIPSQPWFIGQPAGKSAAGGSTVSIQAHARGSAPLAYQWRKNGVNVPGMTNSGLVLTNVVAGQSGNYDVLAMNSGGFATSAIAVITITGVPPAFVQNPLGTSVVSGETLTLSSLANGTDPVSYQWHANGMPIPGQAARTLVASDVSAAAAGAYFVVASNAYGQATSAIANVTVLLPPQYTLGLSNRVEAAGSGVVLRVAARGAAPMTYTWFHNGLMCQTGSENTLALLNVEPRHSGVYRVVARNGQGTTTSVMTLSVFHPPGAVVAWGDDTGGQSSVPAHLPAVVKVAGGDFHTVALLANGSVKAWGFNGDGQTSQPPGLSNVVGIAAGASHSMAVKGNGEVVAWGFNASGQTTVPANATSVTEIAAGEAHSVAARQDGSIVVWGDNTLGQRNVPASTGFVTALAAGRNHTLALQNDGTVIAWGHNASGQAGVPPGLAHVKSIVAGSLHSLALTDAGIVVGWGDNTCGQASVPAGLSNIVAIAAGDFHSCAMRSDGSVIAWGDNSWGQQNLPALLHHARFIGSGYYHGAATVAPFLNYAVTARGLEFSWAGTYVLERAAHADGPFSPAAPARSCTNVVEGGSGFFRLRSLE